MTRISVAPTRARLVRERAASSEAAAPASRSGSVTVNSLPTPGALSTALAPAYYTSDSLLVRLIGVGIGAQWWLNSGNPRAGGRQAWPAAPRDAFASTGHWGQRLIVIPSRDLVVVRFGDEKFGGFASNRFLELVLDALPNEDAAEVEAES